MRKNTPAILLLFLLYTGSYLALVVPEGQLRVHNQLSGVSSLERYRWGGSGARVLYTPLEIIDRAVRPDAWKKWDPVWGD
jgi:hypothetical protein